MKKIETKIPGVYIIESDCYGDNRGWFMETYNEAKFHEMGIDIEFVQDNISFSHRVPLFLFSALYPLL